MLEATASPKLMSPLAAMPVSSQPGEQQDVAPT